MHYQKYPNMRNIKKFWKIKYKKSDKHCKTLKTLHVKVSLWALSNFDQNNEAPPIISTCVLYLKTKQTQQQQKPKTNKQKPQKPQPKHKKLWTNQNKEL